jgi:hypothetical protein
MTPFMHFRLWARQGPASERGIVAVATGLLLALVVWAFVPTGTGGKSAVAATGRSGATATTARATGPAGPEGAADGAAGLAGGSATAVAGGAAANPAAGGPAAPGGPAAQGASGGSQCDNQATDVGVKENEISVGVVLYSLGQSNSLLGIPPDEDSIKMWNAVFDHYNQLGGIQCRKLVPHYYKDFVLDSSSGHAACLQMQQDGVFAVLNNLFNPENRNCVPQAGIPNFWATSPDTAVVQQFSPFVLGYVPDYDRLERDYAFGAQANGFFDGMGKLGLLEQSCYPARVSALRNNLARVGIGQDKISAYNFGCPAQLPTADQTTAAALQFKRDGVTHVMSSYREAPPEFAKAAEAQSFKPKYAFVDDQFSSLANNANPQFPASLDGAIIIEKSQDGAEFVPGTPMSPATDECAAIATSVGLAKPTDTGTLAGELFALACIDVKSLVAAGSATMPLTRAGLAGGLATTGNLDLSFPAGPANFSNPNFPLGAQFWRTSQYHADCHCVKVLDATFRPEFQ